MAKVAAAATLSRACRPVVPQALGPMAAVSRVVVSRQVQYIIVEVEKPIRSVPEVDTALGDLYAVGDMVLHELPLPSSEISCDVGEQPVEDLEGQPGNRCWITARCSRPRSSGSRTGSAHVPRPCRFAVYCIMARCAVYHIKEKSAAGDKANIEQAAQVSQLMFHVLRSKLQSAHGAGKRSRQRLCRRCRFIAPVVLGALLLPGGMAGQMVGKVVVGVGKPAKTAEGVA